MKKLKKLIVAAGLMLSISAFTLTNQTEAATTHKIQYGETYWKIAKGFGIPVNSVMNVNNSKPLIAGQYMTLPNSIFSAADKDLMARLVRAEAVGEPYAGKVAVATVIINRVKYSPDFPNTVRGVIYQISNGHYAFTPVANGQINKPADAESKKAVNEAIALMGKGNRSLFFYNPKTSTSSWILSREVTVRIGNHVFAK
jgi:N-acetylmuramoyl-L-alanine amidase